MDYEALGRYTVACEQVEKLQAQRTQRLACLRIIVSRAEGGGGSRDRYDIRVWESQRAGALVEEIVDFDRQIADLAEEANRSAETVGRPKFVFRTPKQLP